MTCICVLGPHRSGTSAVAGVLHHLGIHMGDDLIGPGHGNPKGHFEDREFVELHDRIIGDWKKPALRVAPYWTEYKALIARRNQAHRVWGVKDPRLTFAFPAFEEVCQEQTRLIATSRPTAITAWSLHSRGGHTTQEAADIAELYRARLERILDVYDYVPTIRVEYDQLIESPILVIDTIAEFLGVQPTQAAYDFIDPSLRHCYVE